MIGKLSGRIDYRAEDHILLDVKGIGYLVYCSERTMMSLPGPGEAVALYTDLLVREDQVPFFFQSSRKRMAPVANVGSGGWRQGVAGHFGGIGRGWCQPRHCFRRLECSESR